MQTALIIPAVLFAGCGNGMKSKEKVQAAIVERLQSKTGLSVNELDVNTTSVTFAKNMAYAMVAIHPKGDATLNHGMAMKYTLEDREGKWVVVKVNSPGGGPLPGMPMSPGAAGDTLPPGHPSVAPGSGMSQSPNALPSPHGMAPDASGPNR